MDPAIVTPSPAPKLPLELILRVLDSLAPPPDTALAICPYRDQNAQCIRTFTRVCRATYAPALRLLYLHCLWIDSSERLRRLVRSLEIHVDRIRLASSSSTTDMKQYESDTAYDTDDTIPRAITQQQLRRRRSRRSSDSNTLPPVSILPCIRNLYLSPYDRSLDDLPTTHWIHELFSLARSHIKRLAVDIPLHTLHPVDDHLNVLPILRSAFSVLEVVEEFSSLHNEGVLRVRPFGEGTFLWTGYTKLTRLAVYDGHELTLEAYRQPQEDRKPIDLGYDMFVYVGVNKMIGRKDGPTRYHFVRRFEETNISFEDGDWEVLRDGEVRKGVSMRRYAHKVLTEQLRDDSNDGGGRQDPDDRRRDHSSGYLDDRVYTDVDLAKSLNIEVDITMGEECDFYGKTTAGLRKWFRDKAVDGSLWTLETA